MNNAEISNVLKQTSRLLEFRDGRSSASDEFLEVSNAVARVEVPLEVFVGALENARDQQELEQMVGFWFGNFSPRLLRDLMKLVSSGSFELREQLLASVSPSAVGLLKLDVLSVDAVRFIRDELRVRNVETLKKACRERFLSKKGGFSENEELDVLEEIQLNEEREVDLVSRLKSGSDDETVASLDEPDFAIDDPDVMFWANADALAEFVLAELREPFKGSVKQTVENLVSSEMFDSVKERARGFVGKIRRFFLSRNDPKYARLQIEEVERLRDRESRLDSIRSETALDIESDRPLSIEKSGALRRGRDAILRLDFLIRSDYPEVAFERVKKSPFVGAVLAEGNRFLAVSLRPDSFIMPFNDRPTPEVPLYFYATTDFVYGTYQVLLASTKAHWNELKRRASLRGFRLTSFGLYEGTRRISSRTANRLYERLELPFVPEELRNGDVEWKWIEAGRPDLVALEDLRGDMHMHTSFTDGAADVETMISFARDLGLSYIALTDHTKNVASAGGMNDAEFLRYWEYIDEVNEKLRSTQVPFRVLKGVEVDILEDGGLDLENETLARADWVVASVHFGKRQSKARIRDRYLDAFLNPYVDVIAHPTGRMIGIEDEIAVDIDFLCENAKKRNKCLELNSQPRRLDLKREFLVRAKEYGVPIIISSDAHSPEQMSYLRFGVLQAYRAGLTPDDVWNTLSVEQLLARRRSFKPDPNAR